MSDASSASQIQTGGSLDPERHVYIERRVDAELLALLERGEYCNILTSRQVGKSSLMVKTAVALGGTGRAVAMVDVAGTLGSPATADEWYCGLLGELARQIGVRKNVRTWWSAAEGTANQRLLQFFREELLPTLDQGLVVFLDEIDHTLKFPYTDDFFTAIRSMYNDRAREPLYRRVAFCLAGVASPNELIKNRRTTAYNVGQAVELADFDADHDDLGPLYRAMSAAGGSGEAIVKAVLQWSGGHPYLTLRLCREFLDAGLRRPEDVDGLVRGAYASLESLSGDVHFQQITRFLEERLTDGPATFALYERILAGKREPDQPALTHTQLKLSGLAKRDARGSLIVRNRIYRQIFDERWVRSSTPLRAANRTRRLAVVMAIGLGLLFAGIVGWNALLQAPDAQQALTLIAGTADEAVARACLAGFTGQPVADVPANLADQMRPCRNVPRLTRWLWRIVYRGQAEAAYARFWDVRARILDDRALSRLKEGRIEEACVLGAAAAFKRDGTLAPEIQQVFDQNRFGPLQFSFRLPPALVDVSDALEFVRARFSTDGSRILVWTMAGPAAIVDATTGQALWTRDALPPPFSKIGTDPPVADSGVFDFTENGRHVLIGIAAKRELAAIGVDSGTVNVTPTDGVLQRAYAGESRVVVLANRPPASTLVIWTPPAQYSTPRLAVGHLDALDFTDDVSRLAFSSGNILSFWVPESGLTRRVQSDSFEPTQTLLLRRDGERLAWVRGGSVNEDVNNPAGSRRHFTEIRDWHSGNLVATLPWPATAFSANGGALLAWGPLQKAPRQTIVIDTTTWRQAWSVPGEPRAISPDGTRVVAWSRERPADTTQTQASRSLAIFTAPSDAPVVRLRGSAAQFARDGRRLVTSVLPIVQVWDVNALVARTPPPSAVPPQRAPAAVITPAERWRRWQTKFGLTLDENDQIVPLWQPRASGETGPRQIDGRAAVSQPAVQR